MKEFRDTRIGITNAARLLNIRVVELKTAIQNGELIRGVEPPKPMYMAGGRQTEMVFRAGDVMDCAEVLQRRSREPT